MRVKRKIKKKPFTKLKWAFKEIIELNGIKYQNNNVIFSPRQPVADPRRTRFQFGLFPRRPARAVTARTFHRTYVVLENHFNLNKMYFFYFHAEPAYCRIIRRNSVKTLRSPLSAQFTRAELNAALCLSTRMRQ